MVPTSWLTAPETTTGLVFTGQFPFTQAPECPVYSQIYALLGNQAGSKAAPTQEKSMAIQARSSSTGLNTSNPNPRPPPPPRLDLRQ